MTTRELLRYHALIAPWMLSYLHDRPVNLHRYPNGAGAKGFWQKAVPTRSPTSSASPSASPTSDPFSETGRDCVPPPRSWYGAASSLQKGAR